MSRSDNHKRKRPNPDPGETLLASYKLFETNGPFRKRELDNPSDIIGQKINALADRWRCKTDTDGKRIMAKILSGYDQQDPVVLSLLKDDPILLTQAYTSQKQNNPPILILQMALMLGAEKTVNHLLEEESVNPNESPYLLGYALSSGNSLFAYRVAHKLKQCQYNSSEGATLYNHCSRQDLKNIKAMFEDVKLTKTI